ncbi:unnamed protein product, partial [Oppiella nova]
MRLVNSSYNIIWIGLSGCGKVYQVKSKKDGEHYAIKEIALKAGKNFREVDILKSIDNINVVKYFDSWCEQGTPADKIYIQMELCGWNNEFYNLHAELCQVEYFITLTLLEEVLEGVNYLQSLTPPIIHRDLKPQNILVKCAGSKWLKIGDFGLAKIQSSASQSNTKDRGARNYRAPEVMMGTRYTELKDLFGRRMLSGMAKDRPSCSDILNELKQSPIQYDLDQVRADKGGETLFSQQRPHYEKLVDILDESGQHRVAQKLRDFNSTLKSLQLEVISTIASGYFGSVYKMKHKTDQK